MRVPSATASSTPQSGVVQRLEEQGDVGGGAGNRVARLAAGEHVGVGQVPRAPRVDLLVVARAVDGDGRGHQLVVALGGYGQHEPEAEWRDDLGAQVVGERQAGSPLDQLGDHPGRRREVELQLRAGLVGQAPLRHRLQPVRPVEHLRVAERREREPGGVGQDLPHRHHLLAVRGELRDDIGDPLVEVEHAFAEELPHHAGDDRPPHRLQDVARLRAGVAVRLEGDEAPGSGDGHLGRRERAVLDLEPSTAQEDVQAGGVDADVGGVDEITGPQDHGPSSASSGATRVQMVFTWRATMSSGMPETDAQKKIVSTGASPM